MDIGFPYPEDKVAIVTIRPVITDNCYLFSPDPLFLPDIFEFEKFGKYAISDYVPHLIMPND
ncbi:hypothetical protein PSEUDO9AZ_20510 [Pseudomonas sp. 9AZ]|nr:hypothetical protein PSEUDO9AZ_20510 [Pseudomonas sp. 9AZ]